MDETIVRMEASEQTAVGSARSFSRRGCPLALFGGGPDGNEQLTTLAGAILIVLLAVIGITILRIRQLIWLHLFVGLLLLGPVIVKIASTGYRFVRYYTNDRAYRDKGPPELALRSIAPIVVACTLAVFATGILLLITGSGGRSQFLLLHKASFIVWLPFTALHVLGHLGTMARSLRRPGWASENLITPGLAGRWIVLLGGLLVGVVVAVALIPEFASWTAHGALAHGHR